MKSSPKSPIFIILALFLIAAIACQSVKPASDVHEPNTSNESMLAPYSSAGSAKSFGDGDYRTAPSSADELNRKIVKTGSMTLEFADISKAQDDIAALASQLNGYVVNSSQHANDEYPSGSISIRVPADKFNEAIQQLRKMCIKVIYETTDSQDVTQQYTDLAAQLKNLQATEEQYLELMKKAGEVKDILEVQRELSNVRGQIEQLKGRMLYLERTSDMSLITISLQQTRPIGESKWDVTAIFKSAVDGLITFGQVLLSGIIWLLVFSPIWIAIILIVLFARRRKKPKA